MESNFHFFLTLRYLKKIQGTDEHVASPGRLNKIHFFSLFMNTAEPPWSRSCKSTELPRLLADSVLFFDEIKC